MIVNQAQRLPVKIGIICSTDYWLFTKLLHCLRVFFVVAVPLISCAPKPREEFVISLIVVVLRLPSNWPRSLGWDWWYRINIPISIKPLRSSKIDAYYMFYWYKCMGDRPRIFLPECRTVIVIVQSEDGVSVHLKSISNLYVKKCVETKNRC